MSNDKGYIKLHRSIWDSEISEKPPHYFKLWVWLLCEANHSSYSKALQRGQLITSYDVMIQALRGIHGNSKRLLKKHHIETVMKYMSETGMIHKRKTTRGLIITICNYDVYQGVVNSETDTETDTETVSKPTSNRQDKQELKNERKKEKKSVLQNNTDTHPFSFLDVEECFKKLESELGKNAKLGAAEKFFLNQEKLEWKYNSKKITNLRPHVMDWISKDAANLETIGRKNNEIKNSKSKLAV